MKKANEILPGIIIGIIDIFYRIQTIDHSLLGDFGWGGVLIVLNITGASWAIARSVSNRENERFVLAFMPFFSFLLALGAFMINEQLLANRDNSKEMLFVKNGDVHISFREDGTYKIMELSRLGNDFYYGEYKKSGDTLLILTDTMTDKLLLDERFLELKEELFHTNKTIISFNKAKHHN